MARDLAREIGRIRVAEARHDRLVGQVRRERRARRRAAAGGGRPWRWFGRPASRAAARAVLTAAPAPRPEEVTEELARALEAVADRIAEAGPAAEEGALAALAEATRVVAPGAAAALLDRTGPEVARLRAFALLHGLVLAGLGHEDSCWLLDELRGTSGGELSSRVA